MDQLQQFIRASQAYVYLLILLAQLVGVGVWWLTARILALDTVFVLISLVASALLIPLLILPVITKLFTSPLKFVWQAILYTTPETAGTKAPDIANIKYARELVTNLVTHIYQLAHVGAEASAAENNKGLDTNFIAQSLPLPLVVLDKDDTVVFANSALTSYLERPADMIQGQNIHSVLDLSFGDENTFDAWHANAKTSAPTATGTWERVRLTIPGEKPTVKLLDLAAYYSKDNVAGYETMLVLFDHSTAYAVENQAVNFVALAVHELRTPLTVLRGYIEALEEDLANTSPEIRQYIERAQASASQLTVFINNILNVAQIDDDQMLFTLQEEKWQEVLPNILKDLEVRARAHGIKITTHIDSDLPTVGIDKVSMYEVVNNLIDNAIKYSTRNRKEIIVTCKRGEHDLVETTIQDFGVGIPANAVPKLFEKFYRDHHNRTRVGGSGLGLYLCKTFITAHGGNIWVRSHEGEGTTFGFTLVPYAQLAAEQKNHNNTDSNPQITRSAHGWIKNHSLYRR